MENSQDDASNSVGAKLLAAKWLEECEAAAGTTFQWSALGLRRKMLLRLIIEQFGLAEDEAAPVRFTSACRTTSEPRGYDRPDNPFRGFWISCLDETALERDARSLWDFVQLLLNGGESPQRRFTSYELSISLPDQAATDRNQLPFPHETNLSRR